MREQTRLAVFVPAGRIKLRKFENLFRAANNDRRHHAEDNE